MAYKHTFNRDYNYLVHFNKNHDPKDGRFTFGDGDGDGILDDHAQRKNFKQFKKSIRGPLHVKANGDFYGYNLSDNYKNKKQDFINKTKTRVTNDDINNLDIDKEIDKQFGKYADTPIWGMPSGLGNNARSFIKKWETSNIKGAVDRKLLKDNGYKMDEEYGFFSKLVKGVEIMIDSADEIEYGNAVAKSIEKNKSKLDKEKDRILSEEIRDWGDNSLSDKRAIGGFKLKSVSVYGDSDTAEANYWWDAPGPDPMGGHEINIEFNIKTGKPITYSVNG